MTHPAARIRKGDAIHDAGVNAATLLLHEVKGVGKVTGDTRPSTPVAVAFQCAAIAASDHGADGNVVLNAICDLVGWALASYVGPAGPERFKIFAEMQGSMLDAADKHAAAIHIGNIKPEGSA